MKTLGKIKLNRFSEVELEQRKMNALKGGCVCGTSCSGCVMCDVTTVNGHLYTSSEVYANLTTFSGGSEYIFNY
jgi:natural product precursor